MVCPLQGANQEIEITRNGIIATLYSSTGAAVGSWPFSTAQHRNEIEASHCEAAFVCVCAISVSNGPGYDGCRRRVL
jgi:hypothetical protein